MMLVLDLWIITLGRFIQAAAAGVILCACNLYLAETIPAAKRPIYGIALNLGVCTGLLISASFGLVLPEGGTAESETT